MYVRHCPCHGAREQRHNRESELGIQYTKLWAESNCVTEFRESLNKDDKFVLGIKAKTGIF